MHKLDSEEALLATFRTRDRSHVELPADLKFPVILRDYVAWPHPAGGRLFLVFSPADGLPTGLVFDSNGGGGQTAQLCSWCHCQTGGHGVSMLTTTRSDKKRVGVLVCGDLGCRQRLEEQCDRTGRNVHDALKALVERISTFAREGLGIDLARR